MDAAHWDARYREADLLWSEGPNLYLADRLAARSPGSGADLGSGEGRNAVWLADRGWKVTAVDFSEVAVERGRQRSDQVEFVVADVTEWEPDEGLDLVVIAYLQVGDEALEAVVERSSTWLAPGGELFMIGHDRSNLDDGYGGPQVPEALWEVDAITDWLDGLRVVEAQVVRRPVATDNGMVSALDSLVRGIRAL